ncbi:hypothetical protein CDAR_97501 [Caerostris darwini]|uniref:Ribosomal protein L2 n=1 Tax=Caerostris darwini TaxID=1538125 RepID=A0AAV4PS33_9ARAC|nr:hypothetical protein CDAR_97501 [Caerostris darwini]
MSYAAENYISSFQAYRAGGLRGKASIGKVVFEHSTPPLIVKENCTRRKPFPDGWRQNQKFDFHSEIRSRSPAKRQIGFAFATRCRPIDFRRKPYVLPVPSRSASRAEFYDFQFQRR